MVPVVQPQGHHRHQPVEHPALDALFEQRLVVVPGQGEHAAEVVVHHPDLHALGGLALQDGQNAVPEDPGLEDEILQKDIFFRLLQLLQHPGEHLVAQGEVLRLGVGVGGTGGPALQITGLSGGVAPQGEQVLRLEVVLQRLGGLLQHTLHPLLGALGDVPPAHQQVKDAAEDGEGQDQQQPGDLIPGLHPAAHDGQGGGHTQGDTAPVKEGGGGEVAHHEGQRGDLGDQGQRHEYRAVKEDIKDFFHVKIPRRYVLLRVQEMFPSSISIRP